MYCKTILTLPYSPNMLKNFPRSLRIRLDTFSLFSEYAERKKNTQKKVFTSTLPGDFKGLNFRWGVIFWPRMHSLHWLFKKNLLSTYIVNNTHNKNRAHLCQKWSKMIKIVGPFFGLDKAKKTFQAAAPFK